MHRLSDSRLCRNPLAGIEVFRRAHEQWVARYARES